MSIAITGALGLIGAAVVRELNERELVDLTLVDFATPRKKTGDELQDAINELDAQQRWRNLSGLMFTEFVEPEEFDPRGHARCQKKSDRQY